VPVKDEIRAVIVSLDRIGAASAQEVKEEGQTAARTQSRTTRMLYAVLALIAAAVFSSSKVVHGIGASIRSLTEEVSPLSDAVQHGTLHVRGRPETVNVEFRPVVDGMNCVRAPRRARRAPGAGARLRRGPGRAELSAAAR
jgi:hypothetical protein